MSVRFALTRAWVALLLVLTALAMPVRAQTPSGSGAVTGMVRDQTGGALPGVTVELLSSRDVVASGSSDGSGRYRLAGIAPGTYTLSLSS